MPNDTPGFRTVTTVNAECPRQREIGPQQVSNSQHSIIDDQLQCDRNATRDVLPNRYQQSWCCPHLKNKNSCKSLDLQLFMRGEADGIRTSNPRIDSPVPAVQAGFLGLVPDTP
jgi:hypothetical protein